jgi:hypothetical protein
MLTVLALLALSAPMALAQGDSCIGIFTDASLSACSAATSVYATTSVRFYAVLDEVEVPTISAVQFKVSNWPAAGANGLITLTWNTPLVIGEPSTDVALAFNPLLAAPIAYLGQADFFVLNAAWIGANYLIEIVPANSQSEVLIVRGSDSVELPVTEASGSFMFNGEHACDCPGTAIGEGSWGSIKALY